MVGSWDIKVEVGKMPEKVATALGNMVDLVGIGAEYTPIAYLGSQVVNGTNHAVLAEQLIVNGKDTKNVVVIILREVQGTVSLVSIERVVESGGELGGIKVDVQTEIPEEAQAAFDAAFTGFTGSNIVPFAYLGSQVTKGTDYIFAAKETPVVMDPKESVVLVTVNGLTRTGTIINLLGSKSTVQGLGYAFTWLK